MDKTLKKDDRIIKELKVKVIRRLICDTDKGALELCIRKGETNYFLTLDAIPLDKEQNNILMDTLFPVREEVPQVQKETEPSHLLVPKDMIKVTKKVVKAIK